jgi:hypothetical protein
MRFPLLMMLFSAPCLIACGSSGDEGPEQPAGGCQFSLSEYPGDCLQLEAPAASEGFQLHHGPASYTDDKDLGRFVLDPGEENVMCMYLTTPNDTEVYFDRYEATMRPGTHHMIVFAGANSPAQDGDLLPCDLDGGGDLQFLVGAQNGLDPSGARIQMPPAGESIAPENAGLATRLAPRTHIAYQLHYVNTGSKPILRESWVNFYTRPKSEVTTIVDPISFIGGFSMNVQPSSTEVVTAGCDVAEPHRIVNLWGHMHAHGTRFSVYKTPPGGKRSLIYEVYDWNHMDTFHYDSAHQNAVPDRALSRAGAHSGLLEVAAGDRVEWECEIKNDTNAPLRWANQAYTAEMCNLFGSHTPGTGGPWRCFSN